VVLLVSFDGFRSPGKYPANHRELLALIAIAYYIQNIVSGGSFSVEFFGRDASARFTESRNQETVFSFVYFGTEPNRITLQHEQNHAAGCS
jgi:hypothetical protein